MELKANNRAEFYQWYLNQPQKDIDLIMKSIKIKNELFNRGLIHNI